MKQEQLIKILTNTFGFFLPTPNTKSYGLPWLMLKSGTILASVEDGVTTFRTTYKKSVEVVTSHTKQKNEKFLDILYGKSKKGFRYVTKNLKVLNKDLVITLIKKALINYDRIHFSENRTLNRNSTIEDFKEFIKSH